MSLFNILFKRQATRADATSLPVRAALPPFPADFQLAGAIRRERTMIDGEACVKTTYADSHAGRAAMARAKLAHELLAGQAWMLPLVASGADWLASPALDDAARLDACAPAADDATRQEMAHQAIEAMFAIFLAGGAHRSLDARCCYWVDGRLIVTGFETMEMYEEGRRPAFPVSFDVTGQNPPGAAMSGAAYYAAAGKGALGEALGVPVEQAIAMLAADLTEGLHGSSVTFQGRKRRKQPKTDRIYPSFALPYLQVPAEQAQRNSTRRLDRFGVTAAALRGKRLIDLGSHVGGMIFESQKFAPLSSLGVEYDPDKVVVAREVAAYNGLNQVRFLCHDVDKLTVDAVGGPCDVVYCLAIVAHLQKPKRLYRLLGDLTREVLFFEGNSSTDRDEAERLLRKSGFREVVQLGDCDDDCRDVNNCRPMLVARK